MASMKASKTSKQTVHRREKDRNRKVSMRASETIEQNEKKTEATKQA